MLVNSDFVTSLDSSGMFETSKPSGLKSILILFRFLILAEHLNSIPFFARHCCPWVLLKYYIELGRICVVVNNA